MTFDTLTCSTTIFHAHLCTRSKTLLKLREDLADVNSSQLYSFTLQQSRDGWDETSDVINVHSSQRYSGVWLVKTKMNHSSSISGRTTGSSISGRTTGSDIFSTKCVKLSHALHECYRTISNLYLRAQVLLFNFDWVSRCSEKTGCYEARRKDNSLACT